MSGSVTRRSGRGRVGAGTALVGLGVLFVLMQLFGASVTGLLWPFFVLAPGLFLFYLVKTLGKGASWLTVPASMLSMFGLVLFAHNATDLWASMIYSWTLVVPTAFGLGLSIYGDLNRNEGLTERGEKIAKTGVGMFLIGAVFFEMVLNISGLMSWAIPLLLVVAGMYFLATRKKRPAAYTAPRRARPVGALSGNSVDEDLELLSRQRDRNRA